MSILDQTLKHLGFLVGCNTQNPPRAIKPKDPIFSYISEKLGVGWDIKITNHGKGRVTFFAKRGNPNTLFNVHLDTVPFGEGWSNDPQKLIVHDKKAYGRGACDIKGAAATLMSLAENTKADMALLFTTDEEGTEGCCVNKFCEGINFQEFKFIPRRPCQRLPYPALRSRSCSSRIPSRQTSRLTPLLLFLLLLLLFLPGKKVQKL